MNKQHLLYVILGLSVVLNAFLIGTAVSHCLHGKPHMNHLQAAEGRLDHAVAVLDQPHQDMIRVLLAKHQKETKPEYDHMNELFGQIRSVLAAPKFDAAKLAHIRRQIEAEDKKLKSSLTAVIDRIAGDLPDDQRIRFFNEALPRHDEKSAKKSSGK
jgi:uncharacterized membrane protein